MVTSVNAPVSRHVSAADPAGAAWDAIRGDLAREFGARTFDSWLKPIRLVAIEQGEAVLALPTHFTCEWVRNNFLERLRSLWAAQGLGVRSVRLVVQAQRAPSDPIPLPTAAAAPVGEPSISSQLEDRFRFDNFIVGRSNELAYNAARTLGEGGPVSFNPLFLHSHTGLGKTHLMHAIGHEFRSRRPGARIAYLSAEKFMVEFLAALKAKDTIRFKQQLRQCDLLMIDDVQFIAGKEQTQEEFFHTVNELIGAGKTLVISADRGPRDLGGMQDRILSRLAGGLVADIQPADYELRLNILHAKLAQLPDIACPNEVTEFLARRITSNVRELEGALNRVAAYAALQGQPVSLEFATRILADILRAHDRRLTIDEIQRKTAEHYRLKLSDLLSPCRAREVARPRQVAMYLAKKLTQRSLPEIGRRFGGRDHTTVLHAVRKIEELRGRDSDINGDVTKLMRTLES